jgi:hypothetical protein
MSQARLRALRGIVVGDEVIRARRCLFVRRRVSRARAAGRTATAAAGRRRSAAARTGSTRAAGIW